MSSAGAAVMQLINGYQVSQALYVATVLGLPDLMVGGPRTSDDLARATATHAQSLHRLLRALAAIGVFHEDADTRFSLTPVGECLRSDAVEPAAAWATLIGRPYIWQTWAGLLHSVQTGEPAFPFIHGSEIWQYRASHPEESRIFERAMTALSRDVVESVVAAYDFTPFSRIVDIGGSHGALLRGILTKVSGPRGIVFDLPHVVQQAGPELERLGISGRCEVIGGDFFEQVPEGDLHLLKAVLHDWDDERAIAILTNCRKAIAPGGKLLVIERVLAGPNAGAEAKFADLNMLVATGGFERSAADFERLFASSGFVLTRMLATGTRMTICEGSC